MRLSIKAMCSALLLVIAVFPDAIFQHSTFRMNDQQWAVWRNLKPSNLYPLPAHTSWYASGLNDPGGALFQSEPMMELMRHNLTAGESPYWNPYSAAGSLGPETLVDLKFSAFTLAYSLLGGGSGVFNFLTLLGYWASAFFIIMICQNFLGLSFLPAISGAIIYLLNGYAVANTASNVAQSYFIVPLCIYSALSFVHKQSLAGFSFFVFGVSLLLSFTFAPTTIVSYGAIAAVALGYSLALRQSVKVQLLNLSTLFIGGTAAAICALALLYFPIIENIEYTGILADYQKRTFFPASPVAILSMFSPSHFFELYTAIQSDAAPIQKNTIFHFGVAGLILASCAIAKPYTWRRPLVVIMIVFLCVILARVFDIPPVPLLFSLVPIIGNLGEQYLWVGASIAISFLLPIGVQNLIAGDNARALTFMVFVAGCVSSVALYLAFGIRQPHIAFKESSLALLGIALLVSTIGVIAARNVDHRYRQAIAFLLVSLLGVELILGAKVVRYPNQDIYHSPTSDVTFLRQNAGLFRTMTLGPYATAFEGGSAFQIQEVTSLNPGSLPGYVAYFNAMIEGVPGESRFGKFLSLAMPQNPQRLDYYDWARINLLGVKYIVFPTLWKGYLEGFAEAGFPTVHTSEFTTIVENPNVLPRTFVVFGIGDGDVNLSKTLTRESVTAATITSYRNASVQIKGSSKEAGLLILTDNWHPTWKATVNDQPAAIVKVNGTFRGVQVPSGPYIVTMTYTPRTLPIAMLVSTLTVILLLIAFVPWSRLTASKVTTSDPG